MPLAYPMLPKPNSHWRAHLSRNSTTQRQHLTYLLLLLLPTRTWVSAPDGLATTKQTCSQVAKFIDDAEMVREPGNGPKNVMAQAQSVARQNKQSNITIINFNTPPANKTQRTFCEIFLCWRNSCLSREGECASILFIMRKIINEKERSDSGTTKGKAMLEGKGTECGLGPENVSISILRFVIQIKRRIKDIM